MARNYAFNTIAAGSASATAALLQTQLRDAIVANAAWSLVDEYDATSTTVHYTVFKCLASASGLTEDFYVMLYRTISTGAIGVIVGDTYNTSTKVITTGPDTSSSVSIAFDANGIPTLVPSMTCLASSPSSANSPAFTAVSMAASVSLLAIVDVDHVVFSFNGSSFYLGAFTTNMAVDPKPVVFATIGSSSTPGSSNGLGTLRYPPGAVSPQTRNGVAIHGGHSVPAWIRPSGAANSDVADHCLGDKPAVWEVAVLHASGTAAQIGTYRGRFKKIVVMNSSPAAAALGDYFPIDGTRWVVISGGAGSIALLSDSGVAV